MSYGNAFAVTAQPRGPHLFLHLFHSRFDVGRSMFDVQSVFVSPDLYFLNY